MIARELGITYSRAQKEISPNEYNLWKDHFTRYPPGDFLTQIILANIWSVLMNALSKNKRKITPFDVAPWLKVKKPKTKEQDDLESASFVASMLNHGK